MSAPPFGQTVMQPARGGISLRLDPVAGPPLTGIEVASDRPSVLGRSSLCQVILPDEAISRRHCQVSSVGGGWFITDLGSRHGTYLNAVRLEAEAVAPLKSGDLVAVGPWSFRVRIGEGKGPAVEGARGVSSVSMLDAAPGRERVERVHERELAAITQNRLQLLMTVAAAVAGTGDETSLAHTIAAAAIEGTGFPRAAVIREVGEAPAGGTRGAAAEVRVVCDIGPDGAPMPASNFSRSLINAARSGEVARLTSDAPMQGAESIMRLGIQTALCAPIVLGSTVAGFLYLDARADEGRAPNTPAGAVVTMGAPHRPRSGGAAAVQGDAAAFCSALAKMYGLAIANISRVELEHRQRELVNDLKAAREAQELIMPPPEGAIGPMRYAVRVKSGRYVAGDLFDVVELAGGKVGVLLGDVAGKGIGAAMLMATAQTHLNVSLRIHGDPGRAAGEATAYVSRHAAASRFISLWMGVFDPAAGTCGYVDAGHGYWILVGPDGSLSRAQSATGIPLGIDAEYVYEQSSMPFTPGSRLVVFSDGVVEQPNPDGAMFGFDRALEAIRGSKDEREDVRRLFDAVLAFAQTDSLADDTTVASVLLT
jgi:serine phosphatase RsbU (regulator of sigma subunit)